MQAFLAHDGILRAGNDAIATMPCLIGAAPLARPCALRLVTAHRINRPIPRVAIEEYRWDMPAVYQVELLGLKRTAAMTPSA